MCRPKRSRRWSAVQRANAPRAARQRSDGAAHRRRAGAAVQRAGGDNAPLCGAENGQGGGSEAAPFARPSAARGRGWRTSVPRRKPGTTRSRQAVYRDLKRACDLLGVAGQVSPHTARKVYAVELRKAEGIEAVQRALQHSSRDITLPYAYADLMQSDNTGVEAAKLELLAEMIADKVLRRLVQNNTNGCSGIDKRRPEA